MMDAAPTTTTLRQGARARQRRRIAVPTAFALTYLAVVVLGCLLAPVLPLPDPLENDLAAILQPPSWDHLLGTDRLGRDVLSRVLWGGQVTLLGSLQVVVVAIPVGVVLGLAAGYFGGRVDQTISRLIDFTLALPNMVITLVFLAVFPTELQFAFFLMGFLLAPPIARVIRASALGVRKELYIDAAQVSGVHPMRVVFSHVTPRLLGPIIVQATLVVALAVLITSGLAYLGFGTQLPSPSWGAIIAEASSVIRQSPWLTIVISAVLVLTTVSLGILGDSFRDSTSATWQGNVAQKRRVRVQPEASVRRQTPGTLMEVRGLSVAVENDGRELRVVTDVSFHVAPREIVGLVGESGCGKTTVIRAILGLLRGTASVAEGSILFDGRELGELSPEEFRVLRGSRMAYIAQEPMAALDPTRRVGQQLADGIRRHRPTTSRRDASAEAVELLRDVQIMSPESVARLYPHQISGGMAQRVGIARALAGRPEIILADEPTTALDVTVQAEILALLSSLRESRGMSMIVVTHDWGVVADLCDRAIVMYAGEIVEAAPVQDLYDLPLHPYSRALLSANPGSGSLDASELPTIPGSIPSPADWPISCRFADRCALSTAACRQAPIDLHQLDESRSSRCIRVDILRREQRAIIPTEVSHAEGVHS